MYRHKYRRLESNVRFGSPHSLSLYLCLCLSLALVLGLSPALFVAMSTALIYWQSMNGSGASNGLESSPATHLASHLAAPAAVSAVDWHYSTPAAAAAAMQQRPPYARNWSAESNSSNSGQHYLAQIGCQHSVKNLVNGFVNASSKFKATAKHNDPLDTNYNCKLYKGCRNIPMYIYLNTAKVKRS